MAARAHLRSIQAESLTHQDGWLKADDDDVDAYVGKVSEEIRECRERGHSWPSSSTVTFSDVTPEGLLVERVDCARCGCAYRQREWQGVRQGRSGVRYRPVGPSKVQYQKNQDGEIYPAPSGMGHITRRQIAESVVTAKFTGKSLTEVRAEAKARGRKLR
jgi:hypothetical protein